MKKRNLIEKICSQNENENLDKISLEKRIVKIFNKIYSKTE